MAGVLIPTFGGIIDKANQSAALQAATNAYKEAYALDLADGVLDGKEGTEFIAYAEATQDNNQTPDVNEAKPEAYSFMKGSTYAMKANAEGEYTFVYTNGKYNASFDSETGKWTIAKHEHSYTDGNCVCGATESN